MFNAGNVTNIEAFRKWCYEAYKVEWLAQRNIFFALYEYDKEYMRNTELFKEYVRTLDEIGASHSEYLIESYLEDFGYKGECYACFEEFLDNEYSDKEYMREILGDEEYAIYLKDEFV